MKVEKTKPASVSLEKGCNGLLPKPVRETAASKVLFLVVQEYQQRSEPDVILKRLPAACRVYDGSRGGEDRTVQQCLDFNSFCFTSHLGDGTIETGKFVIIACNISPYV